MHHACANLHHTWYTQFLLISISIFGISYCCHRKKSAAFAQRFWCGLGMMKLMAKTIRIPNVALVTAVCNSIGCRALFATSAERLTRTPNMQRLSTLIKKTPCNTNKLTKPSETNNEEKTGPWTEAEVGPLVSWCSSIHLYCPQ